MKSDEQGKMSLCCWPRLRGAVEQTASEEDNDGSVSIPYIDMPIAVIKKLLVLKKKMVLR